MFKLKTVVLLSSILVTSAVGYASDDANAKRVDRFQKQVMPVLQQLCSKCHGPDKQEAELQIGRLDPDLVNGNDAEHWEEVLSQLQIGEMPPEDEDQPTAAQRDAITNWLNSELRYAAEIKRSTGGRNLLRRLTRYEYNNTLRDLLGMDLDFAKDLPPEGVAEEGFKNNALVLTTSSLHLEYYQRIAAAALGKAIVSGSQPESVVIQLNAQQLAKARTTGGKTKKNKKRRPDVVEQNVSPSKYVALSAPANNAVFNPARSDASNMHLRLDGLPAAGPIRITVRVSAVNVSKTLPGSLRLELGVNNGAKASPFKTIAERPIDSDQVQDFVFDIRAENFPLTPLSTKAAQFIMVRNTFDVGTANIVQEKRPEIRVESIRIDGPWYPVWPPKTRTDILHERPTGQSDSGYARDVISRFMSRAWRRPAERAEVDRMLALHRTLQDRGNTFQQATAETLSAVLCSPAFLMISEPLSGDVAVEVSRKLTGFELASRLSYFLWSSKPDDELSQLAETGKLHEPSILSQQIDRMLEDHKATAFYKQFSTQWFALDSIHHIAINPEFFPGFDDSMKDEMTAETVAFFRDLVISDRSCLNVIDSDHALLNAKMARYYGILGVAGNTFRPVSLSTDSRRGGVLTHASVLTLNSSGDDTHPVKRGVWLKERLLNDPPAPPPPAVPTLAESEISGERLSLRRKLDAHRKQESCNTCHRRIDPWGISFENYDGIGRWRDSSDAAEPILQNSVTPTTAPNGKSANYSSVPSVKAPQIVLPTDATERVIELTNAVNEALESLQRPYNHLRRLGSKGAADQQSRFIGYITDRTPRLELAIDLLLAETGQDRQEFQKTLYRDHRKALDSNAALLANARTLVPATSIQQTKKRNRSRRSVASAQLNGDVDPTTELFDGTKIKDLDALKQYLLTKRRPQFAEAVVRKMMSYALGRYLDFTDTDAVNAVAADMAASDYQMRALIKSVVMSQPFQTK